MGKHACFLGKGEDGLQLNAGAKTLPENGTSPDKGLMGYEEEVGGAKGEEKRSMNGRVKRQTVRESACERGSRSEEGLGHNRHDYYAHARDFVALCVRMV